MKNIKIDVKKDDTRLQNITKKAKHIVDQMVKGWCHFESGDVTKTDT